ncbi:MAG: hypothetical protein KGY61_11715 [Desulfobacterales bacterium]|nr:hypothetical protein [Desulfobacterales bacterium]
MSGFLIFAITFFLACLLTTCLTPALKLLAQKNNIVAKPKKDRWHKTPKALLGGVSILFATLAAWLTALLFFADFAAVGKPIWIVVAGSIGIFALGLIDDVLEINPQYKLIGQVVIVSSLVFLGIKVSWFDSQTANILISIFWIVGISNAFNLLDNMDGLSAGIAFIAGVFLFIWLSIIPVEHFLSVPVQLLIAGYLGSLVGFLIFNFNPASIFMGDAGSLFIGFMLACLTVIVKPPPGGEGSAFFSHATMIIIPCLILFIPILDVAFVSFMRKLCARSIFQGGKDHSSHRMVAVGMSERKAVLVLYFFAFISGLIALATYPLEMGVSIVVIALYLIFVLLFWLYLANAEVYVDSPGDNNGRRFGGAIFNESNYLRTFLAVLFDLILITVAYYAAYLLRFEGDIGADFSRFLISLPILFACQVLCFYLFGVYQRLWWGSRLGDIGAYVKGVTAGTIMAVLILLFLYRFQSFSRAVFVIYWGVMLIFVSFSRFFFRMLDEWMSHENKNGRPTLVYGAGVGGQMVAREIETNRELDLSLVGFIDDDPMKKGKRIHGYPVFGNKEKLGEVIRKNNIKEIIVSFRTNGSEKKKELERLRMLEGLDISIQQMRLVISP